MLCYSVTDRPTVAPRNRVAAPLSKLVEAGLSVTGVQAPLSAFGTPLEDSLLAPWRLCLSVHKSPLPSNDQHVLSLFLGTRQ